MLSGDGSAASHSLAEKLFRIPVHSGVGKATAGDARGAPPAGGRDLELQTEPYCSWRPVGARELGVRSVRSPTEVTVRFGLAQLIWLRTL